MLLSSSLMFCEWQHASSPIMPLTGWWHRSIVIKQDVKRQLLGELMQRKFLLSVMSGQGTGKQRANIWQTSGKQRANNGQTTGHPFDRRTLQHNLYLPVICPLNNGRVMGK
jgi:hypothetical protein